MNINKLIELTQGREELRDLPLLVCGADVELLTYYKNENTICLESDASLIQKAIEEGASILHFGEDSLEHLQLPEKQPSIKTYRDPYATTKKFMHEMDKLNNLKSFLEGGQVGKEVNYKAIKYLEYYMELLANRVVDAPKHPSPPVSRPTLF